MARLLVIILLCVHSVSQARADTIELFGRDFEKSLAVYGSFIVPPGPTESGGENAKFEFYLRPSITLRRFSDKTKLVGYAIFAVLNDSQGLSYNNKITASFGLELQHRLSPTTRLSFGAKMKGEHEFSTSADRTRAVLTADLNFYKKTQPKWISGRLRSGSYIVFSGWANYRYPGSLHASEKENGLLQGSFKIAASMPLGTSRLAIAPFISLKAKADHKGRAANNIIEPALGVDLEIPFNGGGNIAVGAKSVYQWRHATGTTSSGVLGYVKWYKKF